MIDPKNIRNIMLLGHQGSGKTALTESLLFEAKAIPSKGDTARKNTVSDYLPEEQRRLGSIQVAVAPLDYKGVKINVLDLPGNDDFIGEIIGLTGFVKGAVLVIDASVGVQVGTVKAWNRIRRNNIPAFIFLNKMDREGVDFDALLEEIRSKLGKNAVPFAYPLGHDKSFDGFANVVTLKARVQNGKGCEDAEIFPDKLPKVQELHDVMLEAVAGTDDALLEKFFGGEEFTPEEIASGLRKGVLSGEFIPVLVGSAEKQIGIATLLDMFIEYLPTPADLKPIEGVDGSNKPVSRETSLTAPFSAYCFKTLVDPYYGMINLMKINSGVLHLGDEVSVNDGNTEKVSGLFKMTGKKLDNLTEVGAGDICALTHMDDLRTGMTISDPKNVIVYAPAKFPTAVAYKAIELKDKGLEAKMGTALARIQLEDPTIEVRRNAETKQLLLGGVSSSHVDYAISKLAELYKIEVTTAPMKVVYRESIKATAEAQGSYKKQSGGSGFYGVVDMRFEPSKENEFAEEVFGGAVPKNFFPAVEKGFYEALNTGLLAGFPVIGVKGVLVGGKYHPVDSNELAFKMAAILAFKAAYPKCKPIILEPIMKIRVSVESEYTGDVISDLSTRRGRIRNIEEKEHGQEIEALVPQAEIIDYATQLKSMTKASGYYNQEFFAYEEVPEYLKDEVIAKNKIEN